MKKKRWRNNRGYEVKSDEKGKSYASQTESMNASNDYSPLETKYHACCDAL